METSKANLSEARAAAQMLACIFKQLLEINASNGLVVSDPSRITHFFTLVPPVISLPDYLDRISQHASCSIECYILSLIYVNRLIIRHDLALTQNNVHRVILTSIMLAAKFQDDRYYDNRYYARLGGITLDELNLLEAEFIFGIGFDLFVSETEFKIYENQLMQHVYNSSCSCENYAQIEVEKNLSLQEFVEPMSMSYEYLLSQSVPLPARRVKDVSSLPVGTSLAKTSDYIALQFNYLGYGRK
jgi:hypothetical protein